MRKSKNSPFPASNCRTQKRLLQKQKKAQKRAEREGRIPLNQRPVICPPDRAGRSLPFRILGNLCRILVVWLAASGLTLFIASAMAYDVSYTSLFLITLVVVALVAIWFSHPWGKPLSLLAGIGLVAWRWITTPALPSHIVHSFVALYNGMLERLYHAGFLSYIQYQIPLPGGMTEAALETLGMCIIGAVIAAVFGCSLIKRVHVVPPAILSTTLLVVILSFNLYSNQQGSNLGIALVITSLATLLVLGAYDRLYRVADTRRFDTDLTLFEENDRPVPPPPPEPLAKGTSREQKAAHKALLTQHRREMRLCKAYERKTRQAHAAMGGFAAAATMLLCLLIIALPALTIYSNFSTVDVIDEKVEFIRDYVTAVLQGDGEALDELSYAADQDNFKPRPSDLESLSFTDKQIFRVESTYGKANLYLRGWVATDYQNGAWQAADDNTLATYREHFGTAASPGDVLRYHVYRTVAPSLVDIEGAPDSYLNRAQTHLDYGFVTQLVSLRRINSPDTHLYLPSYPDLNLGLLSYHSIEKNKLTYVNYFDGIYTGRAFGENDAAQATVTYVPLMTNTAWAQNQAQLLASYHLQKEALLARLGYTLADDGKTVESEITLVVQPLDNGTTVFTYRQGTEEWRTMHATPNVTRQKTGWQISTDAGTLTYTLNGQNYITNVLLTGCKNEKGENLLSMYTRAEDKDTRNALVEAVTTDRLYSEFVYNTYTRTGDSLYLKQLAEIIMEQAHTVYPQRVWVEDDPTTPDVDESFLSVIYPPADVTMAPFRSSSSEDTYVQRDILVRNVIDYIINDMGCEYTITPNLSTVDPALDGVENFLRNTRQGYCVQFASAVALLLREMGIPARYTEGYIASDLTRNTTGSEAAYGTYVTDRDAHAWVEVYYDGLGWIPYETTPAYYTAMYGRTGLGGSLAPDTPPENPPHRPEDPPREDETLPETAPDETTPNLGGNETETDENGNPNAAAITRGGLIFLGTILVVAIIIFLIRHVRTHAQHAEEERQSTAFRVMQEGFHHHLNEQEQRDMARTLTDSVTRLLAFYGLSPQAGEFRDEYADRLTTHFLSREDAASETPMPDWHRLLNAIAAEEFGRGMTPDQMKELAQGYFFLRHDIEQRIPFLRRWYLRYWKRLI